MRNEQFVFFSLSLCLPSFLFFFVFVKWFNVFWFDCSQMNNSSDSGIRTPRRKSFYNFFLRHQDAVDDSIASPSVNRKAVSPNASAARSISAANSFDEKQQQQLQTAIPATTKTKRATSFVRKKPPFERGLSAQSALRINKNAQVGK